MKNLFIIATLFFGIAACSSTDDAKEGEKSDSELNKEDQKTEEEKARELDVTYESIASDLCGCVNETTEGISSETVTAMVDADKNDEKIIDIVRQHFTDNPDLALSDGMIMQKAGEEMQTKCLADLEEKYSDVYSATEQESQDRLLIALEKEGACDFTHAIMALGLQMQ